HGRGGDATGPDRGRAAVRLLRCERWRRGEGGRGRRGPGRERDPRAESADRRLARLAGGGLPADAHAQGPTRPGSGLGERALGQARLSARQRGTSNPTPIAFSASATLPAVGSDEADGSQVYRTSVVPTAWRRGSAPGG